MTLYPTLDYLLIGHITADLTPNGRIAGGTVSYAARTAAAFGLRVGLLTSVQRDEPVTASVLPYVHDTVVLPAGETTTFENIYTPQGRIQYVRGAAARIAKADVPAAFLPVPLVHLAPIADEIDWDVAALFPNAVTLLTLQGWLRRWDADGRVHFKRWHDAETLKHIDMVVFSEEDIVEAPELEAEFAGTVEHLFVTRAEKGGTYYHWGDPQPYSTPVVELVHPTGAGDVFAASLLASFAAFDGDIRAATEAAARLAAISVTRVGLDSAPTPDEVGTALAAVRQGRSV
ncbi:MAG: PfkB family carbohydrate kinase [bacterium]|nr:PfkB family carbohydrate kinase [bacterium]